MESCLFNAVGVLNMKQPAGRPAGCVLIVGQHGQSISVFWNTGGGLLHLR
jgi:hypothetical protein